MAEILFLAGHTFNGPSGQGYKLTREVRRHEIVKASDFEPVGGAPSPEPGALIPAWLHAELVAING